MGVIWILLDFTILRLKHLALIPAAAMDGLWENMATQEQMCGVNTAGICAQELNPEMGTDGDGGNWKGVHTRVVQSAYEVITLKGHTNWTSGLNMAKLTESMLKI